MSHSLPVNRFMFAITVQKYNYIALLLLSTFLIKILVTDTQWLLTAITGTEYIHVNPFCKNKNSEGDTKDVKISNMTDISVLALDGLCTSKIFPDENPEKTHISPVSDQIIYRSSGIDDVFQEQNYPPPQFPLMTA